MTINQGMMTSKEIKWNTPLDFFAKYQKKYKLEIDACATPGDNLCAKYFAPLGSNPTEQQRLVMPNLVDPLAYDAFSTSWAKFLTPGHGIWMNPPYGRTIRDWLDKAYREHLSSGHAPVICLLPSRTDTRWWHTYCQPVLDGKVRGSVEFIRGRIHFTNANTGVTGPAPFPSVVVVFGGEP